MEKWHNVSGTRKYAKSVFLARALPWTPLGELTGTGPLFRRSAIPKVHCADTRHFANIWVKVMVGVRVMVSFRVELGLALVGILDFRNSGYGIADPNQLTMLPQTL